MTSTRWPWPFLGATPHKETRAVAITALPWKRQCEKMAVPQSMLSTDRTQLCKWHIHTYVHTCVVRPNAMHVFIAMDHDLNSAHRLAPKPLDSAPHHLPVAVVELGHGQRLKGLEGSCQIMEGDDGIGRA